MMYSVVNIDEIRRRREKLGLTMAEAAELAGWGRKRNRWNDLEKGRKADPQISTLEAIARALGCHVGDLLK